VESIVWGKFNNSGQTYIPRSLEAEFKNLVKSAWKKFTKKHTNQMASIITEQHWDRMRNLIAEAQDTACVEVEILEGVKSTRHTKH